jgi:hypothetical protein
MPWLADLASSSRLCSITALLLRFGAEAATDRCPRYGPLVRARSPCGEATSRAYGGGAWEQDDVAVVTVRLLVVLVVVNPPLGQGGRLKRDVFQDVLEQEND